MHRIIVPIIGYAATLVGISMMIPQTIKSLKIESLEGVSFGTPILFFFNCLLWLIYGCLIQARPVIWANGIALLVSVIQLSVMVSLLKKSKHKDDV